MDRKQAEADAKRRQRDNNGKSGVKSRYAGLLFKMMASVRWYNSRPYAARTYISKVTNLPYLRDAPE